MTLPATLDAGTVRAVAMDLDRTILPDTLELRPRLIGAVRAVAATGESMPPKSTYFFPKVLTGMVFNVLKDRS